MEWSSHLIMIIYDSHALIGPRYNQHDSFFAQNDTFTTYCLIKHLNMWDCPGVWG